MEEQQRRAYQAEEQRKAIMMQILTPEARERLSRIALVKPDRAKMIEESLIMSMQQGRLAGVVNEQTLIQMLEQISNSEQNTKGMKVTIQRRKDFDDDDY